VEERGEHCLAEPAEAAHRAADVVDPFGGSNKVYESCASELADLIKLLVEKLKSEQLR
jgi:protein-tyrosine-phosphatase